jgi:hypothetical protein
LILTSQSLFDASSEVHLHSSLPLTPAIFTMTFPHLLTTMPFEDSRNGRFEHCTQLPCPEGHTSIFSLPDAIPRDSPPFALGLYFRAYGAQGLLTFWRIFDEE